MTDYKSIEELINADASTFTQLRNNSKQDDGTDTVAGVDWFSYAGTVCSNFYVSGNMWIGIGRSQEDLKVNRRDGAMWNLWREEGTLYETYKFLRIRWNGYTAYNSTDDSYKQTFDIFFFDTGDMMLHMVDIPTYANDGTYALVAGSTYSYTVSASSPDVTFYAKSSGVYDLKNEIINLRVPYDRKYLVRTGDTIYTVQDNALVKVAENFISDDAEDWTQGTYNGNVNSFKSASNRIYFTSSVHGVEQKTYYVGGEALDGFNICIYCVREDGTFASQTGWKSIPFQFTSAVGTIGFCAIARLSNNANITPDTLITKETTLYMLPYSKDDGNMSDLFIEYGTDSLPNGALLVPLVNPEVLYWQDSQDELPVLKATLQATPFPQTVVSNMIYLTHPSIAGIEKVEITCQGNPVFACSFDKGVTWKMFDGTNWVELSENDTGMTAETFAGISASQWSQTLNGVTNIMCRFTLFATSDNVEKIFIDFTNN